MNWKSFPWRQSSRSFSVRKHGTYARRYVGKAHPLADASGMAYEHRLVALEAGLLTLRSKRGKNGVHVHHRSARPKTVNRPELLEALPAPTHNALPRRFLGRRRA